MENVQSTLGCYKLCWFVTYIYIGHHLVIMMDISGEKVN